MELDLVPYPRGIEALTRRESKVLFEQWDQGDGRAMGEASGQANKQHPKLHRENQQSAWTRELARTLMPDSTCSRMRGFDQGGWTAVGSGCTFADVEKRSYRACQGLCKSKILEQVKMTSLRYKTF